MSKKTPTLKEAVQAPRFSLELRAEFVANVLAIRATTPDAWARAELIRNMHTAIGNYLPDFREYAEGRRIRERDWVAAKKAAAKRYVRTVKGFTAAELIEFVPANERTGLDELIAQRCADARRCVTEEEACEIAQRKETEQ